MGSPENDRIGLVMCADGVPIYPGYSVMPVQYKVESLPPQLRGKVQWMLLGMLFKDHMKPGAQKKFFDFLVAVELNPLASVGIRNANGGHTKVIIFTTTCDLPGRDKFFQLRG